MEKEVLVEVTVKFEYLVENRYREIRSLVSLVGLEVVVGGEEG